MNTRIEAISIAYFLKFVPRFGETQSQIRNSSKTTTFRDHIPGVLGRRSQKKRQEEIAKKRAEEQIQGEIQEHQNNIAHLTHRIEEHEKGLNSLLALYGSNPPASCQTFRDILRGLGDQKSKAEEGLATKRHNLAELLGGDEPSHRRPGSTAASGPSLEKPLLGDVDGETEYESDENPSEVRSRPTTSAGGHTNENSSV